MHKKDGHIQVSLPPRVVIILNEISEAYSVPVEYLRGGSSAPLAVLGRHEAMRRMRTELAFNAAMIARMLRVDRSTVHHHLSGKRTKTPLKSLEIESPDLSGEWAI